MDEPGVKFIGNYSGNLHEIIRKVGGNFTGKFTGKLPEIQWKFRRNLGEMYGKFTRN
ncbi:hypothetical protein HDU92_007256 [Lobulomyces angularis]|nr:hypothetical protein HDU92_007256 [Lobulomyces angularis]